MDGLIYNKKTKRIFYGKGGEAELLTLRPKELAMWELLIANSTQPVTRELMCSVIWNSRFVSDYTINQTINQLRRKIHDSERTVIVTKPKVGYEIAWDKLKIIETEEESEYEVNDIESSTPCETDENVAMLSQRDNGSDEKWPQMKTVPSCGQMSSHARISSPLGEFIQICKKKYRVASLWSVILLFSWSGGVGAAWLITMMNEDAVFYVDSHLLEIKKTDVMFHQSNGVVECKQLSGNDKRGVIQENQKTFCRLQK